MCEQTQQFTFLFNAAIPYSDTQLQTYSLVWPRVREKKKKIVTDKAGREVFSTSEIRATSVKATQLGLLELSILKESQKSPTLAHRTWQ